MLGVQGVELQKPVTCLREIKGSDERRIQTEIFPCFWIALVDAFCQELVHGLESSFFLGIGQFRTDDAGGLGGGVVRHDHDGVCIGQPHVANVLVVLQPLLMVRTDLRSCGGEGMFFKVVGLHALKGYFGNDSKCTQPHLQSIEQLRLLFACDLDATPCRRYQVHRNDRVVKRGYVGPGTMSPCRDETADLLLFDGGIVR
mmetsp:Transcript_10528/g.20913  ORF Transcript_10528/g.20913 Transcript_10528/m.20913 type:complete len:200 (-) Transcript_10528:488-1087(-)